MIFGVRLNTVGDLSLLYEWAEISGPQSIWPARTVLDIALSDNVPTPRKVTGAGARAG